MEVISDDGATAGSPFTDNSSPQQQTQYRLYAKPDDGWVGDVMPFFENGLYNLFFLHDARDGQPRFHPFHRATTDNLTDYSFLGEAIPFGPMDSQDIALGTGSVFHANDGLYHAFYTGHNYNYPDEGKPREAMMHAVSVDMETWTKLPEDTFFADTSQGYEANDFRDPYVFWCEEDGSYWMLITTRRNGNGVIARYTSHDLSFWTLEEPLYAPESFGIMECSDLFKLGERWYLIFSTDWMTWYRVSDSPYGPWKEPPGVGRWDGRAFYAAKTGGTDKNRVLFGWIPTKNPSKDSGNWEWAGNLAAHQLVQNSDGSLSVAMPAEITELFAPFLKDVGTPKDMIGLVAETNSGIALKGAGEIALAIMGTVADKMLIEADVTVSKDARWVGFTANSVGDATRGFGLNFDASSQRMHMLEGGLEFKTVAKSDYIFVPVDIPDGSPTHIQIVIDKDICVLYWGGKMALSTRMYNLPGSPWGFYAINGDLTVQNITVAVLP